MRCISKLNLPLDEGRLVKFSNAEGPRKEKKNCYTLI